MTKRMKRIAALLTCGLVLASGTSVYAGNAEGTLLGYPISLEVSVRKIVKLEDVSHILMLGGTKEYQVCAVVKDDGVQYNLFDYESGTLTEISLNTVDYQRVEVTQDGKGFYYIGDEGKSLYCYHIDSKENEKIVQAEEVGAEKVTVEGVSEE